MSIRKVSQRAKNFRKIEKKVDEIIDLVGKDGDEIVNTTGIIFQLILRGMQRNMKLTKRRNYGRKKEKV